MSEQREAETAVDRELVHGLADPLFLVDGTGRVLYWNRGCEAEFGIPAETMLGTTLPGPLDDALDEGLRSLLTRSPGDLDPAVLPGVTIGTRSWDVRVCPSCANRATAVYCIPSASYPTTWPRLIAESADAIWALDEEDRLIAWNRGAQELFGYTPDEVLSRPLTTLIPEDLVEAREPERLRKALGELGAVRDYQTRRRTKDGRELEVSLTRTVVRDGAGAPVGSSTIVRDLSQRREVERQVIESEKLATLGQLSASVAKQIGAPLTAVGLVLEQLRRSDALTPDAAAQVDTALQQLNRIGRLSRGLVELAKPGELRVTEIDLREVIEGTLALVDPSLEESGVKATVELEGKLPPIQGDPGQLQQVLLNLLMNARRALESTGGGRIGMSVRVVQGLPAEGRPLRDAIEIEVTDDGPGIEPADLPFVFAPFFSRRGGSGLGLPLAKQIIHAHGGTIEVRSTPGVGATFTILLPVDTE